MADLGSHVDALADELSKLGFLVSVIKGAGYPFVVVTSRDAAMVNEAVYAAPANGEVWFWWSWAEKIAPVTDLETAAGVVAHVLRVL